MTLDEVIENHVRFSSLVRRVTWMDPAWDGP